MLYIKNVLKAGPRLSILPFPPTGNEVRMTGWRLHPAQSNISDTSNFHGDGMFVK